MDKFYITKDGFKKLYEEYLNVDNEILEVNKKIGESVKRDNDLRENPEFMQLRVKAMYELPAKKKSLWEKYNSAIVIEETDEYLHSDGKKVVRGCYVKIDIDQEEICEYQIKGSDEGDLRKNILSCDAPMAQALLGHSTGEVIDFNGLQVKILEIRKQI